MTMNNKENEYVYLDGMFLNEEHLIKLAMNVGCYAQAEHYLFALLAHGVISGKREVMDRVNEVREYYGVPRIPVGDQNATRRTRKYDSVDDKVRAIFKQMDSEKRKKILREGLHYLLTNHHLFIYTRNWMGVFLVIRDRLEGNQVNQSNFYEYAQAITPDDMPQHLRIKKSTAKNFSREIAEEDRGEAYYDMKHNPQQELCDTLWEILKQLILTED